ncbi:hypothetical protein ACFP2F_19330 [Hymenobacter artigasi]|uniref:Uncharacterized protein n=1 Tax=Hymenobacter artigasi TaxID=2719616 RepID=A0ABX1HNA5_9BACT|nr:hypothetical protein [Hymenobacter artigasi]NKI90472.1 hypothetical protein [Hymenobacter artigasi]
MNNAAGSYACRAYFTSWTGGALAVTTRLRDTTIQTSRVDTNTVQTGAAMLDFRPNVAWRGHSPVRPNAGFADNGFQISTTYKVLLLDASSDSLYYENSGSGHSFGQVWRYYGKKVR